MISVINLTIPPAKFASHRAKGAAQGHQYCGSQVFCCILNRCDQILPQMSFQQRQRFTIRDLLYQHFFVQMAVT